MRKYAQPKTAKPAPRDAALSLRMQKQPEGHEPIVHEPMLSLTIPDLPDGWRSGDDTDGVWIEVGAGSATVSAVAECGGASVEKKIHLSGSTDDAYADEYQSYVDVLPSGSVTLTGPGVPDYYHFPADAGLTKWAIYANLLDSFQNGTVTLSIKANNGAELRIQLVLTMIPSEE